MSEKFLQVELDLTTIAETPVPEFNHSQNYAGYPGQEFYRLLAHLSQQFDQGIIIDWCTNDGLAALALSQNPTNTVYSFDEISRIDPQLFLRKNLKFNLANFSQKKDLEQWQELILSSKLIFLDIEPHDGQREYDFYCFLRDHDYQGLLVVDDIWYFKGMRDHFWYQIPSYQKLDVTKLAHWSGTGLVKITAPPKEVQSKKSWTFVTGYFDLTLCEDASNEIKARDSAFYFQAANTTMALDANLVVFCEADKVAQLAALRPAHLREKTKYITCNFDDFPMNRYRPLIKENRLRKPSHDPRNTISYYLFCLSRYAMVKRVIEENPFASTHFAWVNICIERYGYKNVAALEEVMATYRDKFSTCYIDYIDRSMVLDLPKYFEWGRCSLCSGFFTGNAFYFHRFCDLIEQQFIEYVKAGYGHADEQLYSPIYFKHPEIFEVYFGDYQSMVTNYVKIVDDVHAVINHLITNSLNAGNYQVCYLGCRAVWRYCHELQPTKDRSYYAPRNTTILGGSRSKFLRALVVAAHRAEDQTLANQALLELKCQELGH